MKKKELKDIKRLLVNIDMINGFVREGRLHDPSIGKIIFEHVRLIKEFLENDEEVIFFKDVHTMDSVEFGSFPQHCLKGSYESEIVDELLRYSVNRRVYEKNSTSGIFAPGYLEDISMMENLEEIVFTGCCTDLCVMNLVIPQKCYFNEHNRNILLTVPENAVATYDAPTHDSKVYSDMALKLMKLNGVNVVPRYERKWK